LTIEAPLAASFMLIEWHEVIAPGVWQESAGVSLVGQQVLVHGRLSVKERVCQLGWWGLWLVAQRSMRLWLTEPTFDSIGSCRHESPVWTSGRRTQRLGSRGRRRYDS
jgi:hypothetical protein